MDDTLTLLDRLNKDLENGEGLGQGGSHLQQPQVAATAAAATDAAATAAAATPAAATPAASPDESSVGPKVRYPWDSVGLPAPVEDSPWADARDQGVWSSNSSCHWCLH